MNNKELIEAINANQKKEFLHPLTCGADDCRAELIAVEEDNAVILVCPECDYKQYHIPPMFCSDFKNPLERFLKK